MSDILTKIKSTADILGGDVFFATEDGKDPEILENGDLLANGMYIRLNGSDGSVAYISAFELDKSIEIIDNMSKGKANKADVDALRLLLDEKASTTDMDLFQSTLDTKASQEDLNTLSTTVNTKASQESVDNIITLLNEKASQESVDSLTEVVNTKASQESLNSLTEVVNSKADNSSITEMQADIAALETAMGNIVDSSSIKAIQDQIAFLNNEINKKLTADSLTPITSDIEELESANEDTISRLENVEGQLVKKATTTYVQTQVSEIQKTLTDIATVVDTKADKTDVANKASKSDVEKLSTKVSELNVTVGTTLTNLDSNYNDLVNTVNSKADKNSTETAIAELTAAVESKADSFEVAESITGVTSRLTRLETTKNDGINEITASLNELQCNVNNAISEINATVSNQGRQITNQNTQISKLQEKDIAVEESIKNEWVRVITPEAYKKLAPIGSLLPNGSPDPRAKKPNTVYMLVRYNKPISVYIGDILIAQAEQKGSVGFAYTFPISF